MGRTTTRLRDVLLDVPLKELLGYDLFGAVVAGSGAIWLSLARPDLLFGATAVAAGIVGVVIGAVIAALALTAAFLNAEFLRKLDDIDTSPLYLVGPFLMTTVLGVVAAIALAALAASSPTAPGWWLAPVAAIGYGSGAWTLLSLIRDLDVLVQFVQIQQLAARIPLDNVAPLVADREQEARE